MTYLDYFFIFIILLSFLVGCYRGFTRELLSLIGWIFAFYIAHNFSGDFLKHVPFEFGEQINFIIIYVSIFITILLLATFLAFLINKVIKTIGLGPLNIIMGCIFGFMRGVLISFVIIFLVEKTSFINEASLDESKTIPIVKFLIKKTLSYLPHEWSNKVKYDPKFT
jgi:membrane protein required for colicin V production|tara:strand:- start:6472 stop:6972 length:501 start_codon:yes stop_codon:yes gene_type:complete